MMKETRTVEKIFQYVLLEQTEEKHFFSCVLVFFLVSERTEQTTRKRKKERSNRERERETNEREKERERT